ncbi:MAG: TonB-dependent receptor [Chitinophagaceae bacterium]|nr:MAG: TonB-dependent receptor [Chitinophagaceae bacterium]
MRKLTLLCFTALLLQSAVSAQYITGTVKDLQGKPMEKTTVTLLHASDSQVVKLSITDKEGMYSIAATPGKYRLSVSYIGYTTLVSPVVELAEAGLKMQDLIMAGTNASLDAVTITSKKPIVEVMADKTILNVEGTINAVGNDALELLRKSPGVMVDKDDNLSLAGKNGVQVFVDGKPSPLSGSDLANYLKTLQSAQIEAIELITNPSAKYEAAGNAGIINIRLKKNKTFGTNGSVNAGYNIGTFGKYNGGFSLNHRNSRINAFGNYNYSQGLNVNNMVSYREQADSIFDQKTQMRFRNKWTHNFKAGLDYFLNAKSTIGAMVNGNLSNNTMRTQGPMQIRAEGDAQPSRILDASNESKAERSNVNFNVNYRYAQTGGKVLNIDADYGFFDLSSNQYQPNFYYDVVAGQRVPAYANIYRMIAPTDIKIYSLKGDYEQDFIKGKLGLGAKLAYVNTDNDFQRYNVLGSGDQLDAERSNRFRYKENINAGYINYNRAFKGFMVQAGLRVENTHSEGNSTGSKYNSNTGNFEPYDSSLNRDYTDLFPSAAVTFNKNPMSQFGLTFSRRIDRPAYQDLNPFEFKLNDYTSMKGNTRLRPQYTNSFGVTHTYKYRLNTALNYSHVKDIFTQLPDTTEKSKSFMSKSNLATQDIISLNISYPFQYKWYSFFANLNSYYSKYKADFGGGDRTVNLDVFAFNFYMQNSFKLSKTLTAEISGFYTSPTIWQGTFKSIAMGSVDGGLLKTILKGKGTVKASVTDMFRLMRWKGESNFTGVTSIASGRWESRQFRINFNYRFGNTQVKASRQRKTGQEDESKRADGGTGTTPGGN